MKRTLRWSNLPRKACLFGSLVGGILYAPHLLAEDGLISAPITSAPVQVADDFTFEDPTVGDGSIEVINERYPSGAIKVRREVKQDAEGNYVLHGQWKMWDRQGKLVAEGEYRENQRHGQWTRWYAGNDAKLFATSPYASFEGPFTSQATFNNGQLDGKWIISDREGRKISEWSYQNGLRDGLATWHHPKGHKIQEVTYRNGLLDGELVIWDAAGEVAQKETYQQGRKLALKTESYRNGAKKSEGMYLHAQHIVKTRDDWWNAQPAVYTTQGRDERHGAWSSWHQNGQQEIDAEYRNDIPIGHFTRWYENGQKQMEGDYIEGKQHGMWVWWHANGQKSTQGAYVEGEPRGPWAYWKENGRIHQKADFSAAAEAVVTAPETKKGQKAEPSRTLQQRRSASLPLQNGR